MNRESLDQRIRDTEIKEGIWLEHAIALDQTLIDRWYTICSFNTPLLDDRSQKDLTAVFAGLHTRLRWWLWPSETKYEGYAEILRKYSPMYGRNYWETKSRVQEMELEEFGRTFS